MLSLHISSKAGTEIFKGEYQIIDDINGIPTLETDYSKTRYSHEEPLFMMSNAYTDKFVMIIKEQSSKGESNKTRYTAVHSFIYDFSLDRIYDTYTQYFSLENALSLLFDGTGYDFEVKADQTYYALDFQNFGDDDKMNLLNKICERWELEYHITGNTVVFGQRRGQKTNKQFRYKMNITDSSVDLDISEGATYIRATFGSEEKGTLTEREMTHPLADRFGIRHAKPYSNENITQEETMQKYMQQKIEDTWKLSIKIDISDIEGSGDIEVGDTVWAIDERLDLSYNTRVVELKRYYNKNDEVYKTEAVLGNRTFADTMSAQERTPQQEIEDNIIDQTNKKLAELQAKFDNDFNAARDEFRGLFDSAVEAATNEVQAAEQRMAALIGQTREDFETDFNAEIERIEQEALAEYNRISGEITSSIDQARSEIEQDYSQAVQGARDYADAEILAKEQQYVEDWDIRDAQIQSTIEKIIGGSVDSFDSSLIEINSGLSEINNKLLDKLEIEDISDLYANVDTITTTLNATRDDLQQQLDDAKAEFDSLQVGARNLIIDSEDLKPSSNNANVIVSKVSDGIYDNVFKSETKIAGESSYFTTIYGQVSEHPKIGQKATLSLLVRGVVFEGYSNTLNIHYNSGTKNQDMTGITEEYQWLSVTFNVHSEESRFHLYPKNFSEMYIARAKLEIGNVATDWTPAPEDTEQKIITLNQEITTIDGLLKSKVDQTEMDILAGTVTQQGTLITQTAADIATKADKSVVDTLTGTVSNVQSATTQNAEKIEQSLTRISNAEGKIESAETAISTTADGLNALVTRTEDIEGEVSQLETKFNVEAGKIATTMTRVDEAETAISTFQATADGLSAQFGQYQTDFGDDMQALTAQVASYDASVNGFRSEVGVLQSDIDGIDDWIETKGSVIDQTADAITAKVWQQDINNLEIGARNLISKSDVVEHFSDWQGFGSAKVTLTSNEHLNGYLWIYRNDAADSSPVAAYSPPLTQHLMAGREYTVRFKATHFRNSNPDMTYMYFINDTPNTSNQPFGSSVEVNRRKFTENVYSDEWIYEITAIPNFSGQARILFGTRATATVSQTSFYIKDPMLVEGSKVIGDYQPAPEDVAADVSTVTQTASTLRSEVNTLITDTDNLKDWRAEKGSIFEQTADKITAKVWNKDIDKLTFQNENLIPHSENLWENGGIFYASGNYNSNQLPDRIRIKEDQFIPISKGEKYTFSDSSTYVSAIEEWRIYEYDGETFIGNTAVGRGQSYTFTATGDRFRLMAVPMTNFAVRLNFLSDGRLKSKLEIGERATPWSSSPKDSLQQTDFILREDSFLLGTREVGGRVFAAGIVGDASGLKLLGDNIDVAGNLNVKNTVSAWSVDAVEADIGSIFANTANIDFITAKHINALAIGAKHLFIDTALINKLSASTLFTNMLTAKTISAIEGNFADVITTNLETHKLRAKHINANAIGAQQLYVTNAMIEKLIANSILTDEMTARSIEAVNANITNIRSKILTSDVILSKHIKASNFIVDKIFGTTALIERLTSKAAFISYIRSHIVDADTVQVGFNGVSSSVRITGSGLETYNGSKRTSLLDRVGHRFYYDGVYTGQIGTGHIENNPKQRGLRFQASQDAEYLAWSKQTGTGTSEMLMSWLKSGSSKGFRFYDTARFSERVYATQRIYANSGMYFGEDNNSYITKTGTNLEIRHNSNGSSINLHSNNSVSFSSYGNVTHAFFANGTKTGGSIEIDGTRYGMSPIDSPQVLIEYIEFDVELSRFGTKIMIDETYLKSVVNFAVFLNNGELISKNKDHIVVKGEGTADIRFVGERIEHDNVMWADMYTKEDEEEAIEHESEPAPKLYMDGA